VSAHIILASPSARLLLLKKLRIRPILPHNQIRAQVPTRATASTRSRNPRKFLNDRYGHKIVLRMKHHDFVASTSAAGTLGYKTSRPTASSNPFREPIPSPNAARRYVHSWDSKSPSSALAAKSPIHHDNSHHPFHSRISDERIAAAPPKLPPITNTSSAHSRNRRQTPARETLSPTRRLHPEYPCAEPLQKFAATLQPPIARIKHPISFADRNPPTAASENRSIPSHRTIARCVFKTRPAAKIRNNVACKSCSEH